MSNSGNKSEVNKANKSNSGKKSNTNISNKNTLSPQALTIRKLIYALFYLNILRFLPIILNMVDQSIQGGGLIANLGEYLPLMLNVATCIILLILSVKKKECGFAMAFVIWALFTATNIAGALIPSNGAQGLAQTAEEVAVKSFGLSETITCIGIVAQLVFYIIYSQAMINMLGKKGTDAFMQWKMLRGLFIVVYGSSLGAVLAALVPGMEALVGILGLIVLMTTFLSMIFHVYTLQLTAISIKG